MEQDGWTVAVARSRKRRQRRGGAGKELVNEILNPPLRPPQHTTTTQQGEGHGLASETMHLPQHTPKIEVIKQVSFAETYEVFEIVDDGTDHFAFDNTA